MDHTATGDRDFDVDLESGRIVDKNENEAIVYINLMNPKEVEDPILLTPERVGGCKTPGSAEKKEASKEKRKKSSNKKPPRPPRPPRCPSLDAADQKLMREITELAMLKRARIERMKALKKAKNCKASSFSSNTVLALVFTVIFFIVVIFQGVSPKAESPLMSLEGPSPESAGGLISVQYHLSSSVNFVNPPTDASHSLVQKVAVSDAHEEPAGTVAG
ncbi:uncharacterized protein LOC116209321 [Punica granatum]|uniref:Uncharacterized protein n=2 Tax=Punica granatum TaxID=22663 RepID=A0A2I0K267_PUNGR|nr:uncharacterized protein LOC116209321 [Punica granatum]PKI62648.1 hypothetical protein CRG98_016919 [Punica granatum]